MRDRFFSVVRPEEIASFEDVQKQPEGRIDLFDKVIAKARSLREETMADEKWLLCFAGGVERVPVNLANTLQRVEIDELGYGLRSVFKYGLTIFVDEADAWCGGNDDVERSQLRAFLRIASHTARYRIWVVFSSTHFSFEQSRRIDNMPSEGISWYPNDAGRDWIPNVAPTMVPPQEWDIFDHSELDHCMKQVDEVAKIRCLSKRPSTRATARPIHRKARLPLPSRTQHPTSHHNRANQQAHWV
jgi:hypothetical protein